MRTGECRAVLGDGQTLRLNLHEVGDRPGPGNEPSKTINARRRLTVVMLPEHLDQDARQAPSTPELLTEDRVYLIRQRTL